MFQALCWVLKKKNKEMNQSVVILALRVQMKRQPDKIINVMQFMIHKCIKSMVLTMSGASLVAQP